MDTPTSVLSTNYKSIGNIQSDSPPSIDECDILLQQVVQFKEKLVKHSQAKDAAIKRIHDLEMVLITHRKDLNEIQSERDLLQDQVSDQLQIISSLQIRLDDQRFKAEQFEKQTNTSLETHIFDLQDEIKDLVDTITKKDKTIKQLNKVVDEIKVKLQQKEEKIKSNDDFKLIEKLQKENATLLDKINTDAQNAQVLPNLVDNILADKNADIEVLRTKLDKTETELNLYQSLNFDHEQLKALSCLQSSDRAFFDRFSLIDVDIRKVVKSCDSLNLTYELPQYKHNVNESTLASQELSSIEKVCEQQNIHYSIGPLLTKPNCTEIRSAEKKKVYFEDADQIAKLEKELHEKDEIITDYDKRLKLLSRLENTTEELQNKLDDTEKALAVATGTLEKEQFALKEVRVELAEKNMHLIDKERQLETYVQDTVRGNHMYITLAKENRQLEAQLKNQNAAVEKVRELDKDLSEKQVELEKLQSIIVALESVNFQLQQRDDVNAKLTKDIKNLEAQYDLLNKEIESSNRIINDKNKEIDCFRKEQQTQDILEGKIKELNNIIVDKQIEIDILNEDVNHYQDDIAKLEDEIKIAKKTTSNEVKIKLAKHERDVAARNLQIEKLTSEIIDYKRELEQQTEVMNEKDNVIKQMTRDYKTLHLNLETIQSKLHESENIVYLKEQLEEQKRLNKQLEEDLRLRSDFDYNKAIEMTTSIDEITGAVCKQLDYSAHLDTNIFNSVGVCDLEELLEEERAKNTHLQEVLEKQQVENSEMINKSNMRLEQALSELVVQKKYVRNFLEQQLKEIKHARKRLSEK